MTVLTTCAIDEAPSHGAVTDTYEYDAFGNLATRANDKRTSPCAVTDTYEYDAFGNQVSHTGSTPNNYLYRGEQFDPALGLYYLRARYYNPLAGRFMSRDPSGGNGGDPKSQHKYLYATADPVNRIDPHGREAFEEYHVTLICGGSLYCGPLLSWKAATVYTFLAIYLWEHLSPYFVEGPPGLLPVGAGRRPPGAPPRPPEEPPISGPPAP